MEIPPLLFKYTTYLEERQSIFHKRFLGQSPPWTDDEILAKNKFCNNYRILDRSSQYEFSSFIVPADDLKKMAYDIILYRHTNSIKTNEILKNPEWSFEKKKEKLYELQNQPKTRKSFLVSDALMFVPGLGYDRVNWILHFKECLDKSIDEIEKVLRNEHPNESLKFLTQILPRVGMFLSYEVHISLTYSRPQLYPWTEDDFVVVGPGALPGLQLLYKEPKSYFTSRLKDPNFLLDLRDSVKQELIEDGKFIFPDKKYLGYKGQDKQFTLHTLEMTLCELRKYINLSNGRGRSRRYTK